ncbi:MAG: hypothetical protein IT210_17030 [Armatimonadetes bacterium]|nr:hypothetical protein [Armatimonadota bacterium]
MRSVGFQAFCAEGALAFRTDTIARIEQQADGQRIYFNLSGPACGQAEVEAVVRPVPRGALLRWTVRYKGEAKGFFPWQTGFIFDFGAPVVSASSVSTRKWVKPTGKFAWEVPGDMAYPDFECQVRKIGLRGMPPMALATRWYDGDWLYGSDIRRARFIKAVLPKDAPSETTFTFALLNAQNTEPEDLAAIACGHPLSFRVRASRVGNLYKPGEKAAATVRIANVSDQPVDSELAWQVRDYYGDLLASGTKRWRLEPGMATSFPVRAAYRKQGILFTVTDLSVGPWTRQEWLTAGFLPERPLAPPDTSSPFGMAGFISTPSRYPDHPKPETLLPLAQRIGVRWIRTAPFPVQGTFTPEEEKGTRDKVALYRRYGMAFHPQIGADLMQRPGWQDDLRVTLKKWGWVSDYIEFGNEMNPQNASAEGLRRAGADYVERVLKPLHKIMREAHPNGKVLNAGLGGVWEPYLEGIEQAGGFGLLDILSVHPGLQPKAPEFYEGWKGWVYRTQMEDAFKFARRHNKPVWITEIYAPTPPDRSAVDLRTSADYLVRIYVLSIAMGVQNTEWYQFTDGVWYAFIPNPLDPEYNFGIIYTDLSPKPAYLAYGAMTRLLEGARCLGRISLGADDLYRVRFRKGGRNIDVLWSYREKHETDLAWWPPEEFKNKSRRPGMPWQPRWRKPVALSLPASRPATVTDVMGNSRTARPVGGSLRLELTGSPVFVEGLADER